MPRSCAVMVERLEIGAAKWAVRKLVAVAGANDEPRLHVVARNEARKIGQCRESPEACDRLAHEQRVALPKAGQECSWRKRAEGHGRAGHPPSL